ncbi:hypothetical protein VTH06DRAFT_2088 [Thermothelomyces fergusii]
MEALLGAGRSNPTCCSLADLQAQLRDLVQSRVADTRAEHISVTFEIQATATFDIPVTGTEHDLLEKASNIDPSLGGTRSGAAPATNGNAGQPTRRVSAIDALINQPVDDPVLQTAIARQIISSVGEADSSNWAVRQVSRIEQSWTFAYICKNSWETWNRQASKTPAKILIGEWSGEGGQDPIHMARPAFDCRGCVKITFVKSTKTVSVKYEHTPMHKTVGELMELLAPPPVAPMVKTPIRKVKVPKTPKEARPPMEPKAKTPRSSKKRAEPNGVPGGEGSQSKRRRKKDSLAPVAAVPAPEMPGALPVADSSGHQPYNGNGNGDSNPGGTPTVSQPPDSGAYPDGLVNGTDGVQSAAPADADDYAQCVLNLPPGEAARRREVAIKLLQDNNIDPQSLTAEQFNIFANQSPELQQESLKMLIKYGAERLRIVHPNSKDGSGSGQSTPSSPATPSRAENTPQTTGSGRPPADSNGATAEAVGTQGPGLTEGKPRGRICEGCRLRKYKGKCDKARPSCNICLAEGIACTYAPKKPRKSKAAETDPRAPETSQQVVPNGEQQDGVGSLASHTTHPAPQPPDVPFGHPVNETAPVQEAHEERPQQTVAMPASDSSSAHNQPQTASDVYRQPHETYQHPSSLNFPQVSTSAAETAQSSISSTSLEPTSTSYNIPTSAAEAPSAALHSFAYPQPSANHENPAGYPEQVAPVPRLRHHGQGSAGTQATARRSLPSEPVAHGSGTNVATVDGTQSTWQSVASTASRARRSSPEQARSRKPPDVSQAYNDFRQQPTSSWGNASQPVSAHTTGGNPQGQSTAQPPRAKSRQANRVSAAAIQQPASTQGYTYANQYQHGGSQAESSSDHIPYQPYAGPASNQPALFSMSDSYNAQTSYGASSTYSAAGSQNVASSYPSSHQGPPSSTAQWGTPTAASQPQNTNTYDAAQSDTGGGASYNAASNTRKSRSRQGSSMRPQPTQARSSSTAYSQHQQPQQQQQQQQQPLQQQQHQRQHHGQHYLPQAQPQQAYQGYMTHMSHHHHHQQQASSGSYQGREFGFGATAASSTSSGYNSAAAGGGGGGGGANAYSAGPGASGGHGHSTHAQQAQHHGRSMGLANPAYGASIGGGDPALYELLRSNPAG